MKHCEAYLEQISAHIDGELDYQDEIELFVHLESCPRCMQTMDAYRITSQALTDWEADPPPNLVKDVMAQINGRPLVLQPGRPRRPKRRRFAAVAAIFAVVVLAGLSGVWGGFIPGVEFTASPDGMMQAPAAERFGTAPAPAAAPAPAPGEFAPWDAAVAGEAEVAEEESYGLADVDADGRGAAEEVPEQDDSTIGILGGPERGDLTDTTLLDMILVLEGVNWGALTRDLQRGGFSYERQGNAFRVPDARNPGSYLYGVLYGDLDTPEELVVSVIGYRLRAGALDRRVEVRIDARGEGYYYAVPREFEGGVSAASRERLWEFIVTG